MYGPCLSAIVGGHALTPPTRHRLGRLLPYQQADRNKAAPMAHSYVLYPIKSGTIQYYPSFRKAILDLGVRSLLLLTRLPLPRPLGENFQSTNNPILK